MTVYFDTFNASMCQNQTINKDNKVIFTFLFIYLSLVFFSKFSTIQKYCTVKKRFKKLTHTGGWYLQTFWDFLKKFGVV